jgi:hypothetical protein
MNSEGQREHDALLIRQINEYIRKLEDERNRIIASEYAAQDELARVRAQNVHMVNTIFDWERRNDANLSTIEHLVAIIQARVYHGHIPMEILVRFYATYRFPL